MNYDKETFVRFCRRPEWGWAADLIIYRRDKRGGALEVGEVVFKAADSEGYTSPALRANDQGAEQMLQSVMNDLWAMGVRPSGEGTAGQLAQAEKHLADLRKIAFHALKIPGA